MDGVVIPLTGATRLAAVIGWPVAHSRSPLLHNAAYQAAGIDAVYVAFAVEPQLLASALASVHALRLLGLNVTLPHKEAAARLCDELSESAARTAAVNTVVPVDGKLVGHNTDVDGFADALAERAPGLSRGRAVLLGAGGAARAVVVALIALGFQVTVVSRDQDKALRLIDMGALEAVPWRTASVGAVLHGAALLVDATSAGMSPADEAAMPPVPLEALPSDAVVATLVYHREPALLAAARARGLRTFDGASMLVHQAAHAFALMTRVPAPVDVMRRAFVDAAQASPPIDR